MESSKDLVSRMLRPPDDILEGMPTAEEMLRRFRGLSREELAFYTARTDPLRRVELPHGYIPGDPGLTGIRPEYYPEGYSGPLTMGGNIDMILRRAGHSPEDIERLKSLPGVTGQYGKALGVPYIDAFAEAGGTGAIRGLLKQGRRQSTRDLIQQQSFLSPDIGLPSRRPRLPMDEASRLKRAEEMGFDLDLYHGTPVPMRPGEEWTSLEPSVRGNMGPGIYLGDANFASHYAKLPRSSTPQPRVYPVKVRSKKLIHTDSDEMQELVRRSGGEGSYEQLAKEAGYEGMYRNPPMPGEWAELTGLEKMIDRPASPFTAVIFDPKNMRSPWARFDPSKAGSSDLLAGIGGLASARYMSNALREDQR